MSPRWYDQRTGDHLALDTGGGPIARLWSTALSGLVDIGYVKATGHSVKINLPKTALMPEAEFEWKIPQVEQLIERDRRAHLLPGLRCRDSALLSSRRRCAEVERRRTLRPGRDFKVPEEAIGCGFHEAVRGVLVAPRGRSATARSPTTIPIHQHPWNANPRDIYGTPGPYEDAVQNTPIFEDNGPENLQGHRHYARRARSFDPCLPCGVHMYLGDGKVIERKHSPMFGAAGPE